MFCIFVTASLFLLFGIIFAYKYNLNKMSDAFLSASFTGANQTAYDLTSKDFKKNATLSQFTDLNAFVKNSFGEFIEKKSTSFFPTKDPTGKFKIIQYLAKFNKKENVLITLIFIRENKQWLVQGIFYK